MTMDKLHPCCDPTTPSPIWEGKPVGKIISIDGIDTYISQPGMRETPNPTAVSSSAAPDLTETGNRPRVILFLTEGHGIYLPNAQLLADSFATCLSCDVIMPDEFAGQARLPKGIVPSIADGKEGVQPAVVPWTEDKDDVNYEIRGIPLPLKEKVESSDVYPFMKPPWWKEESATEFEAWKKRHEPHATDPILEKAVRYIHTTYGKDVKIGGAGYCFGGRYVIRLMGAGILDVGVINHPSFFTMEEVGKLGKGKSLAIYAAETDNILPPEKRRETEDVLTKVGATWMSTVFSGTEHGFSVRGDLTVKEVKFAKEKAFQGAVEWFKEWL